MAFSDTSHVSQPSRDAFQVKAARNKSQPIVTSFGLAVIDEIHFGHGRVVTGVLGGSGSFFTAGARILCGDEDANNVAWRVHAGEDFPSDVEAGLSEWQIDLCIQKLEGHKSTRGLLMYADGTFGRKLVLAVPDTDLRRVAKTFRYTTPVLQVTPTDLHGSRALTAQAFHFLATPLDMQRYAGELRDLITSQTDKPDRDEPLIIWEPAPPSCLPENLSACFEAARSVDVFSPNHIELLRLFGLEAEMHDKRVLESLATAFLQSGIGRKGDGLAVIRAGEHGSLTMKRGSPPCWQTPFYNGDPHDTRKIVGTTGAGNAFLGGLAVGLVRKGSVPEASRFGAVAASFMLEQVGLPKLGFGELTEVWNGDTPTRRLDVLRSRER